MPRARDAALRFGLLVLVPLAASQQALAEDAGALRSDAHGSDAKSADAGTLSPDAGVGAAGDTDAGAEAADAGYWHEATAAELPDAGNMPVPLVEAAAQLPSSPIQQQDAPSGDQQAAARPGNATLDRSLRGFIPIPGTRAIFRLGGFVRLLLVSTSKAVGSQDQWVTSTIPVQGQPGYETGEQFNVDANQSRLTLEFRSPSPLGSVRVYYENDFANTNDQSFVYHLRYFYAQAANLFVGFGDSLLVDVDARAETLDLQGPNGAVKLKDAMIRYFLVVEHGSERVNYFALSIESSGSQLPPSIPGPRSPLPDVVASFRSEGRLGHLQLGAVFRDLSYQDPSNGQGQSVFGWGVSATANVNLWGRDHISGQVNYGHGFGAYIADTSGGEYDAVLDSNGQLTALPLLSGFVSFTHHWSDEFWSCLSYGFLTLDDYAYSASLGATALQSSQYASLNLVYRPTRRVTIGVEGLYGHNQAISNAGGNAYRGLLLLQYNFF